VLKAAAHLWEADLSSTSQDPPADPARAEALAHIHTPVVVWVLLAGIIAVATLVRVHNLSKEGFWLDEFFSLELSSGRGLADLAVPRGVVIERAPRLTNLQDAPAWWNIFRRMDADTAPPMYYLALRFWRDMFGDSEATVRSLSVLASVGAIVALFFAARESVGSAAALWACAMMAVASPQITYAQETRAYALVLMLSMLAALTALKLKQRESWVAASLLGVLVMAMMLTHYFAIAPATAIFVFVLVAARGRARKQALLALTVPAIVFVVAWGPMLLRQRDAFATANPMTDAPEGHVARTLIRAASVPVRQLIGEPTDSAAFAAVLVLCYVTLLFGLRKRAELLLWALIAVCPILLLLFLDLKNGSMQLTLVRYSLLAAPAVFVIAASAVPASMKHWRHIAAACVFAIGLWYMPGAYRPWRGDWRAAAAYVEAHGAPTKPVILTSGAAGSPSSGWLLLGLSHYAPAWRGPVVLFDAPASHEVRAQLAAAGSDLAMVRTPDRSPAALFPNCVAGNPMQWPNVGTAWSIRWLTSGPSDPRTSSPQTAPTPRGAGG
jgi:hypothetical protein